MAAFNYQNTDVSYRFTGTSVTVADDCFAKLMYYLDCIDSCIPNVIPAYLRNHRNYRSLDKDDKRQVVAWARQLSPGLMDDVIFYHVEGLGDSSNEFVEISVARRTITGVATSGGTVLIGGRRVNAANVMFYKAAWIRNYYAIPMRQAEEKLTSSVCSIM